MDLSFRHLLTLRCTSYSTYTFESAKPSVGLQCWRDIEQGKINRNMVSQYRGHSAHPLVRRFALVAPRTDQLRCRLRNCAKIVPAVFSN